MGWVLSTAPLLSPISPQTERGDARRVVHEPHRGCRLSDGAIHGGDRCDLRADFVPAGLKPFAQITGRCRTGRGRRSTRSEAAERSNASAATLRTEDERKRKELTIPTLEQFGEESSRPTLAIGWIAPVLVTMIPGSVCPPSAGSATPPFDTLSHLCPRPCPPPRLRADIAATGPSAPVLYSIHVWPRSTRAERLTPQVATRASSLPGSSPADPWWSTAGCAWSHTCWIK